MLGYSIRCIDSRQKAVRRQGIITLERLWSMHEEKQVRSLGPPPSLVFCFRSFETNGSAFPGYNTPVSDNGGEPFGFRHSRPAAACPIRRQNTQDVPRFPAQRKQFVTQPAEYWL